MNPSAETLSPSQDCLNQYVQLNRDTREVLVDGRPVALTSTEFRLLTIFLESEGEVISREKLLSQVWGHKAYVDTRTTDTHISRLRKKLGQASRMIKTVYGYGFRASK